MKKIIILLLLLFSISVNAKEDVLILEGIGKDYYYLTLQRREDQVRSDFYEESRKYFESHYDGDDWSCYPRIDHESRDNEMGELFTPMGILQPQMTAMERAYKISRNEFFITVAGLAISFYNDSPNVKISWITTVVKIWRRSIRWVCSSAIFRSLFASMTVTRCATYLQMSISRCERELSIAATPM
jgi:hypothetical protein